MTTLSPAWVSTRQFLYDPASRTFSADISDTAGLGRVYDDAADEGLTLVSSKTGKQIVFVVTNVSTDNDRDIICWSLKPVSSEYRFTMVLWND